MCGTYRTTSNGFIVHNALLLPKNLAAEVLTEQIDVAITLWTCILDLHVRISPRQLTIVVYLSRGSKALFKI